MHLLLDLSGHTAANRLPVFAWKPAPVLVSWLGYFATTGLVEMDYLVADRIGVPDAAQGQFSEEIFYLPDTRLCFTAPPAAPSPNAPPALANGFITFGSFQHMPKINDNVLAAWARILSALPTARLRLQSRSLGLPAVQQQLAQRMARAGLDPARVRMSPPGDRAAYLGAHAEIDVILDTFPYPGGTTTCEALWMGVPTLTLAGDRLLSRQGASMLAVAGLPDWVATSVDDYVAKAIDLSEDVTALARLRGTLRPRVLASPLFDAPRFAAHFADALWKMWQQKNK